MFYILYEQQDDESTSSTQSSTEFQIIQNYIFKYTLIKQLKKLKQELEKLANKSNDIYYYISILDDIEDIYKYLSADTLLAIYNDIMNSLQSIVNNKTKEKDNNNTD